MPVMNKNGAFIGIGLAPISAPLIVTLLKGSFDPISFVIAYVVALFIFIVIGLPAVIWLDSRRRLNPLTLSICGAFGGVLVCALFAAWGFGSGSIRDMSLQAAAQELIWCASIGLAVAWTFGIFAGITNASS